MRAFDVVVYIVAGVVVALVAYGAQALGRRSVCRATEQELIARTNSYAKRFGLSHRRGEPARDYEARVFAATVARDAAERSETGTKCDWRVQ